MNAVDIAELDEIIKSRTRPSPKQNHTFALHPRTFGDVATPTCLDQAERARSGEEVAVSYVDQLRSRISDIDAQLISSTKISRQGR